MLRHARRMLLMVTIIAAMASFAIAGTVQEPCVVATYFHSTFRCQTCLHIESLARHDVTDVMANDLATGRLAWRSVNIEDEGNTHFVDEFGLESATLVVTLEDGGEVVKWVRLDRVWELHDDVKAFDKYVLGTLEEYLVAASEIAATRQVSEESR